MEKRNPNSENAVLVTTYPNILLYNLLILTYLQKKNKRKSTTENMIPMSICSPPQKNYFVTIFVCLSVYLLLHTKYINYLHMTYIHVIRCSILSFDFHQKHVKEINKFIQIENKNVSHLVYFVASAGN
jgi:hypothetical protein